MLAAENFGFFGGRGGRILAFHIVDEEEEEEERGRRRDQMDFGLKIFFFNFFFNFDFIFYLTDKINE